MNENPTNRKLFNHGCIQAAYFTQDLTRILSSTFNWITSIYCNSSAAYGHRRVVETSSRKTAHRKCQVTAKNTLHKKMQAQHHVFFLFSFLHENQPLLLRCPSIATLQSRTWHILYCIRLWWVNHWEASLMLFCYRLNLCTWISAYKHHCTQTTCQETSPWCCKLKPLKDIREKVVNNPTGQPVYVAERSRSPPVVRDGPGSTPEAGGLSWPYRLLHLFRIGKMGSS